MDAWIERETAGSRFSDHRLDKRCHKLLESLSQGMGDTLPLACQDWAATKAAYRFLDNPRVDESTILAGHFDATRSRFAASDDLALVLHDTTEFVGCSEPRRVVCVKVLNTERLQWSRYLPITDRVCLSRTESSDPDNLA